MKKIVTVIGLGYVGSATAIAIASSKKNYFVYGLEKNHKESIRRIKSLNNSKFPFNTNDVKLKKTLNYIIKEKKNFFCLTDDSVLEKSDYILININFDISKSKNKIRFDLDPFKKTITQIGSKMNEDALLIVNSTVPPGTCENIILPIIKSQFKKRKLNDSKIYIAHSYERVMPGINYFDSITNYWRVFSGINKDSQKKCYNFLKSFINTKEYPLTKLDSTKDSETAKVLENTYRAVNIALINEWTEFSHLVGVKLSKVIKAIKLRPTHSNLMNPGLGVGGYCLTKDPLFAKLSINQIFKVNKKINFDFATQAIITNSKMPIVSYNLIKNIFKNKIKNKRFLLLGVAYKNDIGDTRNSPTEILAKKMISDDAILDFYDPYVDYWDEMKIPVKQNLNFSQKYDAIIMTVAHSYFKKISYKKLLHLFKKNSHFIDLTNSLSKTQMDYLNSSKIKISFIG